MTGSAIAIPLLGATGASAAEGGTWDKVAECETGGSWSANTGNGHFGGLQLTQGEWERYGGLDYATRPDLASRNQQIAVAERILADQGVGHWPTCGLLSGLSQDSGSADVDTGIEGEVTVGGSDSSEYPISSGLSNLPASSGSSGAVDSSDGASESPSVDTSGRPSDEPSASASTSDTSGNTGNSELFSGSGAGGSQETGSSSSGTPNADEPDNSEYIVGVSSLVDTGALGAGRHRGDSADEDAADTAAAESTGRHASRADVAVDTYTVREGDTLTSIADSLGVEGGWGELYAGNKEAIGADPSHIVPGQTLKVGA